MVTIGSAEFILSADNAKLVGDLARAERATRDSANKQAAAIAKANDVAVADVKRAVAARIAEEKKAEAAAIQSAKRIEDARKGAGSGFTDGTKAALGFGTALLGIGGAAATAALAIKGVAEATQEQAQAQFAVNKLYGQSAPLITKQAEALAKSSGKSQKEALAAASAVANLGRQYAFTGEQQKKVLEISADLAAVKGITLEQATQRISDALRGEAEAAEYLGQVLNNDAVKAFAKMTDEQRKNFETLDPITKAQLTLGKLLGDNNDLMGAAAERANSATGAYDRFTGAAADLAAELGKIVNPAIAEQTNIFSDALVGLREFIKGYGELRQAQAELAREGRNADLITDYDAIRERILQNRGHLPRDLQIGPDAGLAGSGQGTEDQIREAQNGRALAQQRAAASRDAIRSFVEERKKAIKDVADADEKAARAEAKRVDEAIERQKIRLEVEREGRLKALEEVERAAIKSIEAEARASKEASEEAVKQAERERDVKIQTVEEAAAQAIKAIDAQKAAYEAARLSEDRQTADARLVEDRELERSRTNEDRYRSLHHTNVLREIEEEHEAAVKGFEREQAAAEKTRDSRLRDIDQQIEKERSRHEKRLEQIADEQARAQEQSEAAIEDLDAQIQAARDVRDQRSRAADDEKDALRAAHGLRSREFEAEKDGIQAVHDARMQALDDEKDAARAAYDAAVEALEEQSRAEDDRHRGVLDNLREEERTRLAAIDAELAALDALDNAAADTAQDRQQQDAVKNAELGVKKAESTGNYSEILKAQQALAEAIDDIRQTGVKRERDAQRAQLKANQDAIREETRLKERAEDEANRRREQELRDARETAQDILAAQLKGIEARERSENEALAALLKNLKTRQQADDDTLAKQLQSIEDRERAETDALNLFIRGIEARKEQIADELKQQLDALKKRKESEDDSLADTLKRLDKRKAGVKDEYDEAVEAIAERRDKEKDANKEATEEANQAFEAAGQRLKDQRQGEDDALRDRRLAEDRDREDRRKLEDEALQLQIDAIKSNLRNERDAIDEHYKGPNGVIDKIQKAAQAATAIYQARLETTKQQFKDERDAINATYRNTAKTGLLDLQDEAARNNAERLADQLADIVKWKDKANEYVDDQKGKWKDLGEAIDDVANKIRKLPRSVAPNNQGGYGNQPYGPPDPGGGSGGPGPNPPPVTTPTPAPGIGSPGAGGVNVSPDRFNTSFGFLARYTNPFNPRIPRHRGVDLVVAGAPNGGKGMPVGAFREGTVTATTIDPNGGNGVTIRHSDGLYGRYFHFDEINARRGESVKRGDQIGILGDSGTQGSPHLHYEIARNGQIGDFEDQGEPLIDPRPYMQAHRYGGVISRPSFLVDASSRRAWGTIAEDGPEMVLPAGRPSPIRMSAPPESARFHDASGVGPYALMGEDGARGGAYIDLRGAQIYDGNQFKRKVVEALRGSSSQGQVKLVTR